MRRLSSIQHALVATAAVLAWPAKAGAEAKCRSDDDCAPYELCTVSIGDCGADDAPLTVCTGRCRGGESWRVVVRLAGTSVWTDRAHLGARAGVDLVPPILGGRLSLAADVWTRRLFRIGVAASWPLSRGLLVGGRVDALTLTGTFGAGAAVRAELFPWAAWPFLTPAHYFSLSLEGGLLAADVRRPSEASPFAAFGVALWPRTW